MIAYKRFDVYTQCSIDLTENEWDKIVGEESTMHFALGNVQVDTYYGYSEIDDDHFIYQRIIIT